MKDLLLFLDVVVKTLKFGNRHFADYVKELYLSVCCTCGTIIFPHSTNQIIGEFRQTRLRQQEERQTKKKLRISAIISELFKVITLGKCVQTILELNWNQCFRGKETKLNICHHMLTSSGQLQNRSFHVVERSRTSAKCPKMKNARAKRAKVLFFIVKYANL